MAMAIGPSSEVWRAASATAPAWGAVLQSSIQDLIILIQAVQRDVATLSAAASPSRTQWISAASRA